MQKLFWLIFIKRLSQKRRGVFSNAKPMLFLQTFPILKMKKVCTRYIARQGGKTRYRFGPLYTLTENDKAKHALESMVLQVLGMPTLSKM